MYCYYTIISLSNSTVNKSGGHSKQFASATAIHNPAKQIIETQAGLCVAAGKNKAEWCIEGSGGT